MSSAVPLVPLGEIARISKGKKPKSLSLNAIDDTYLPYILIESFGSQYNQFTNDKTCRLVCESDIEIVWDGERAGLVSKGHKGYLGSTLASVSLTHESFDSEFIFYILQEKQNYLRQGAEGTGVPHLSRWVVENLSIYKLPLPEQKKIASILTSVDEVIENTQKQIDKLQDLKKATMNELLTKGIDQTEFKDSELGQIPKSWEALPLGDIVNLKQGVQVDLKFQKTEVTEGYLPFLRIENYTQNSTDIRFIPEQYARGSMVSIDDVVMVRYGATAGFVGQGQTGVLANNLFSVTPLQEQMTKPFLKLLLDSSFKEFQDAMAGGAMPALNFGMFKSIIKVVPPVDEQVKIAGYVSAIDFNIKALNKKIHQTQSLKKSLMQDLLTGKVRVTVN